MSLVISKEVALVARLLVVHFENMGRETLRTGGLVVAEQTHEGLGVGVEVALETPIVGAGPRTVAAHKPLLALQLLRFPVRRLFVLYRCRRHLMGRLNVV